MSEGPASLRGLPNSSVDFLFSNAVLQKVARAEVLALLVEMRRVTRSNGFSSHSIDLRDALDDRLNHLQFPEHVWDSAGSHRSGRYTNRYRFSEWLALFGQAGFKVDVPEIDRWDLLPISPAQIDPALRDFTEDDLCVKSFRATLR